MQAHRGLHLGAAYHAGKGCTLGSNHGQGGHPKLGREFPQVGGPAALMIMFAVPGWFGSWVGRLVLPHWACIATTFVHAEAAAAPLAILALGDRPRGTNDASS